MPSFAYAKPQHVPHQYPAPAPRPPSPTYSDRPSRAPQRGSRRGAFAFGAGIHDFSGPAQRLQAVGEWAQARQAGGGGGPGVSPEELSGAIERAAVEQHALARAYARPSRPLPHGLETPAMTDRKAEGRRTATTTSAPLDGDGLAGAGARLRPRPSPPGRPGAQVAQAAAPSSFGGGTASIVTQRAPRVQAGV
jgi:hypothetical protein